jgi:3-phenylpropionate/cinnamic acid dioxygenase small subunit
MKRFPSTSIWLAAGFLIAACFGPGEFSIGSRNVQAADSFEVDRQQILDLISRYSYTWDGKDAEAYTALFQDNATMSTYSAGTLNSITRSNKERLARAHERFHSFTVQGIQTRHYQTNTILERQSDGSVRGNTLFQVVWQYAAEPAPKLVHSGTYRDLFARTSSGWRFASREIHIDHK